MTKDEIEYRIPWKEALLLLGIWLLGALIEAQNWTPFW